MYLSALMCFVLQKGLLEVLYDIFRLPVPIITQDFTEGLQSVGKNISRIIKFKFDICASPHGIFLSGDFLYCKNM